MNRRPAGTARAAKLNDPISESSFRLVVLCGPDQLSGSESLGGWSPAPTQERLS